MAGIFADICIVFLQTKLSPYIFPAYLCAHMGLNLKGNWTYMTQPQGLLTGIRMGAVRSPYVAQSQFPYPVQDNWQQKKEVSQFVLSFL